jgi:hypothetical protein
MKAVELLAELRALDVELVVSGDRLRYRPASVLSPDQLADLQELKPQLIELLRDWPEISLDYLERFGVPEARLYPFLDREVTTPEGRGRLIQVIAPHAVVALERDPGRAVFFLWEEVHP